MLDGATARCSQFGLCFLSMNVNDDWPELYSKQFSFREKNTITGISLVKYRDFPARFVRYLYDPRVPPPRNKGSATRRFRDALAQLIAEDFVFAKPLDPTMTAYERLCETECKHEEYLSSLGITSLGVDITDNIHVHLNSTVDEEEVMRLLRKLDSELFKAPRVSFEIFYPAVLVSARN